MLTFGIQRMKSSFKRFAQQSLLLLLLAAAAAALTSWMHPRTPVLGEQPLEPGEVRLQTVLEWENVIWLDARSRAEFEEEHIPGAQLLNEDEWETLFFDFLDTWDPDQPIVVYCGSTQCQASKKVAERLREDLGDGQDVYVLKGGWSAWLER